MLTFAIENNKNNKAMENKLILSDYAQKVWNKVFSGYLIIIGGKSNYAPTLFFAKGITLYSWNSELGEMQILWSGSWLFIFWLCVKGIEKYGDDEQ